MSNKVSDMTLKRVYILFAFLFVFSCCIVYRIVTIQFFQKDRWVEAVSADRVYEKRVPAARGNILSDNGEVLATSQPFYLLPIDPTLIDTTGATFRAELDSLSQLLAGRFGNEQRNSDWYKDMLLSKMRAKGKQRDRHVFLSNQKVDFEDYRVMREWPILRRGRFKGGLIPHKLNNTRFYPFDSLARITLGLMMHDTMPLKGLEFSFHRYLKGLDGSLMVERMAGGYEMPLEIYREDEDGADIETSINVQMQDIVEMELRKGVTRHQAKYGVAVLMETATGEIKAIANYPEEQNNAFASRIEPGSTFKLASFMAALEDQRISLDDSVDTGNGTIRFFDRVMKDHLGVGKVTWRKVFEESVNTATAKMINENYGKDINRWFAHLDKFGLTKPVMRQEHLVGEPMPKVVRPGQPGWSGTTLPWMAIGYNTQLTPLQIVTFYNAVANNGRMLEPILVKRIRKGSQILKEFKAEVINPQIASPRTIALARELMEGVVKRGTASGLSIEECTLAGKTGTAKKYDDNLNSYVSIYQASFCGYFPAEKPKYTCYIMIDEPQGNYYGANVAGPVFREIARQVYASDMELVPRYVPKPRLHLSRPLAVLVNQANADAVYRHLDVSTSKSAESVWGRVKQSGSSIHISHVEMPNGKVPNVVGMSAKDAMSLLETMNLRVKLIGSGKVRSQSMRPGTTIQPFTTIQLRLN
jgi:cell division protein FtsI (penicillin-binding protein 3)